MLIFMVFLLFGFFYTMRSESDGISGFGDKVAIINLFGVIESSSDIVRQLDKWSHDGRVKAIVMHIDSPGGGVAASQEIYEKILKVRKESKKPVVADMASVCASGGYYVACAADRLVANPGTITGSIGVIFEWPVAEKMLDKVGLKFETIKSGKRKDVGSPWREATDLDKTMLQSVVDDTYEQFVDVLVTNRNLSRDDVLAMADGSIFSGKQAQEKGLVDSLGTFDDAVDLAGELAGIGKNPDRIREIPRRRATLFDLIGNLLKLDVGSLLGGESQVVYPKLQYIFK